jgi:acyl-[acyl-carrier-protein]-phospholipid O-acyltransferase/long-chain-fatty-acid--[acyl-carrier-protein] ligase
MLQRLQNISSFTYLNVTQFLGALNDNLFKLLIVYFCIDLMGVEHSTRILAIAGAFFVVPFLLFSSASGMLADRFSKRNIIVICKVMELVIMALGVLALTWQSPWGAYIILFLMATQSALFGPSKYGIIHELVETEKLSKANGILSSMTYLAIIVGTFLASFLTHITGRNFILGGIICTMISLVGVVVSLLIDKTPPSGSNKKIHPWFLLEVYRTTRLIAEKPILLIAMIGSAYFLFAGAFIQLNIIPYAMEILHMTDVQGGYLFLLTAVGIGIGSMLAGKISGRSIELGLVPIGGIGMAVGGILMDSLSDHPWAIITLIPLLGMAGGLYLVPLDSYIQFASPSRHRGQIVATTNFFGFLGVLLASGALYFISDVLGKPADKGFTIFGILTGFMVICAIWAVYHHFTRYLGMLLAKLHYQMTITGEEEVPADKPSIFLCQHTAWNDTLLLLGSQRTPVRFFTEKVLDHSPLVKWFYSLLKIVSIPSIDLIEDDAERMKQIRNSLRRGISICLFIAPGTEGEALERVLESLRQLREGTPYKLVNVELHKGVKCARTDRFRQLIEKVRIPATIEFSAT